MNTAIKRYTIQMLRSDIQGMNNLLAAQQSEFRFEIKEGPSADHLNLRSVKTGQVEKYLASGSPRDCREAAQKWINHGKPISEKAANERYIDSELGIVMPMPGDTVDPDSIYAIQVRFTKGRSTKWLSIKPGQIIPVLDAIRIAYIAKDAKQ